VSLSVDEEASEEENFGGYLLERCVNDCREIQSGITGSSISLSLPSCHLAVGMGSRLRLAIYLFLVN
jgi:hypothetical protein